MSDFLKSDCCPDGDSIPPTDDLLSYEISDGEIEDALKNLKAGKSPGEDGIPPEYFKLSEKILIPYLKLLFNKIMFTGVFPECWNVGLIIPLFKSGNRSDPNNYRGFSVQNVTGKLFTRENV